MIMKTAGTIFVLVTIFKIITEQRRIRESTSVFSIILTIKMWSWNEKPCFNWITEKNMNWTTKKGKRTNQSFILKGVISSLKNLLTLSKTKTANLFRNFKTSSGTNYFKKTSWIIFIVVPIVKKVVSDYLNTRNNNNLAFLFNRGNFMGVNFFLGGNLIWQSQHITT